MLAFGYSLNMLTLFGLVLAIGLVVDDAIVVVERVLTHMEIDKLPAKQATIKAMEEVSGAIVATTLVLLAIFVPVGFMGGITGKIYQQFAVSISVAVFFSSINALTLSPALCATLLRPLKPISKGPLLWFNKFINKSRDTYVGIVGIFGRKVGVVAVVYGLASFAVFYTSAKPRLFPMKTKVLLWEIFNFLKVLQEKEHKNLLIGYRLF
jgi:multidrug efflux pump subunit AcrB